MWCGDWKKNWTEQCDPNDSNKTWWWDDGCSNSCTSESVVKIDSKELLWNSTEFEVWQKIWFKVSFSNPTDSVITDVVIKDFFPFQLKYDNDIKIVNLGNPKIWSYKSWWVSVWSYYLWSVMVVELSWFSMDPGQKWYFYITWTVESVSDNWANWACSYKKDWTTNESLCKNATFNVKKSLEITKQASKTSVSVWEVVDYTITIKNVGWVYTWLKIADTLSGGLSYIKDSFKVTKWKATIRNTNIVWNNMTLELLDIWDFAFQDSIELQYSVRVDEVRESYGNHVCVLEWTRKINCIDKIIRKKEAVLSIDKRIGKTDDFDEKWWSKTQIFEGTSGAYFRIDVTCEDSSLTGFKFVDKYNQKLFSFDLKDGDELENQIVRSTSDEYGFDSYWSNNGNWELTIWVVMNKWTFVKWDVYSVILPVTLLAKEWINKACLLNWQCSYAEFGSMPSQPICWDGIQGGFEYCDLWTAWWIVNDAGKLFNNWDVFDPQYANWACTDKCALKSWSIIPACFNVQNGSISIMTWELLPFYWNIEWLLWKNRSSTEREQYLRDNFFSKGNNSDCNIDNIYKIDLNSLKCDFIIYGPSHDRVQNIIYKLDNIPCIWINWWWNGSTFPSIKWWWRTSSYYPAIQHFIEQNWSWWFGGSTSVSDSRWWVYDIKNVFETMDDTWNAGYPTLFPYSSKLIIENFGAASSRVLWANISVSLSSSLDYFWEYKISLDNISYDYCDYAIDGDKIVYKMTSKNTNDRVCEVDFAVTNHYLVQKSPLWYVDHETVTKLNSYYLKNGKRLFTLETGDEKIANYQMMSNISGNFDTFISKYSRNAKLVSDLNLRQVPWKMIYLTDLGSGKDFELPDKLLSKGKPFTLIATNWANIKIKGNVVQNMMIITQWKIIFDAEYACNAKENWDTKYSRAWQLVQWIFYAWAWYDSVNDKLNNDVMNDYWCNYWNLHIKWVILWRLDDVKNSRRSELYTWFSKNWSEASDKKREIVLNGASVMVEFNSNLLSSNIPWVDEFNKLLVTQRE